MPKFTEGPAPTVDGGTLVQIDNSGDMSRWYVDVNIAANTTTTVTAYFDHLSGVPHHSVSSLIMHPGYPNPFNPSTTLSYSLPQDGHVRMAIIDLRGKEVNLLVDEPQNAGDHSVIWNGLDKTGKTVASGTYIVQVRSAGEIRTGKISLSK